VGFDFDFNIPTALKGWVGHAPQGRGALHHSFQVEQLLPLLWNDGNRAAITAIPNHQHINRGN